MTLPGAWTFTIPGQPPSVNKSYRITRQSRLRDDGTTYTYSTLSKRKAVLDYQTVATMLCRAAKPKGWSPKGFVRVSLELWVGRHIDSDNVIKALFDSIQEATGVNDKWYLPCVFKMHIGEAAKDWRVQVTIRDD